MGNAQVRAIFPHAPAHLLGMHGAAIAVDVEAVRMIVEHEHLGADLAQHAGG